jgi:transcriptional regulator with XRE-family HTH domain
MSRFNGSALGARIKLLRELRGMTLQQVADAAELTKSHVWELEQGRSVNPTVNAVWGLATALTVTPAQLLGLDDKTPIASSFALKVAGMIDREMKARAASADTHPKGGDAKQAPLVSGAVPREGEADAQPPSGSSHEQD